MIEPQRNPGAARADGLSPKEAIEARASDDADVRDVVSGTSSDKNAESRSTADRLVELALDLFRFGVTDTGEAFAVRKGGPNIARMMRGGRTSLRSELAAAYRREHKKTPNASALVDALTVLEGEAQDAEAEQVHVRVARHYGNVMIDMGDAAGRAIEVHPGGGTFSMRVRCCSAAASSPAPIPNPLLARMSKN